MMLLWMAALAISANAIPAKPGIVKTLKLDDGTTVTARLVGDEHGHYWLSDDGKAYLAEEGTGLFKAINTTSLESKAEVRRQMANSRRANRMQARKIGSVGNYTGKKKGIIILVNFSNVSFKSANNNSLYQRIANERNFSYGNFKGSMYDYFYDQSDGKFELEFDVVGPVTVSNTQYYYGQNDSDGNDKYAATMVIEACRLANSSVNFADYDWDGDGYVDQVYVVYAGKGEADGGTSYTIWPHEFSLSAAYKYLQDGEGAITLDNVVIDTYACGGELNGQTGSIAGIGTMCHEFSHCLGYPDFYDTNYSGGQGMGYWDLMDSGSYNDDGYQPAGYTSYERWVAGWKEPIELTSSMAVENMKPLQKGGETYIIYNDANRNEFFLLENRQFIDWDESIPGRGLLILHCDYNQTAWNNNTPNDDPSHQRLTWIAADNKYDCTIYNQTKYYSFDGMKTDTYPYGSVNAFGKSTTPAAKLFNKNSNGTYYLETSVNNITQNSDSTISFNYVGISNIAKPTFSPEAGTYTDSVQVTINCETEGTKIYYTIDGTTPTSNSTLYTNPITIYTTTTINAIAVADDENSNVATAKYVIRTPGSDTNTFKLVTSVDELESGKRYILACGSKSKAAGALSSGGKNTYLSDVDVTVEDDIITITDDVTVFTLDGSGNSYSLANDEGEYLYAKGAKKVDYTTTESTWTVEDATNGVILTYGNNGTMLYNASSPRFTTYTSGTNENMIYANLYMECSSKINPTLTFSTSEATATIGEDFEEPTLSITPQDISVKYSSSDTLVATVDETSGVVTLQGEGTTTITATSVATSTYNSVTASYTLTVTKVTEEVKYVLVQSTSQIQDGDSILIVAQYDGQYYALSTTQNNRNRSAVAVTLNSDNSISATEQTQSIVLEKADSCWQFNVGDGYLCSSSNTANMLNTSQTSGENTTAKLTIDQGSASILFQGYSHNDLRFNYNNGSPLFSCYTSTSTLTPVMIYRRAKPLLGDANGDGYVSVADVTITVNYMLDDQEITNFVFENADVDGNGNITVNDVTMIISIILSN